MLSDRGQLPLVRSRHLGLSRCTDGPHRRERQTGVCIAVRTWMVIRGCWYRFDAADTCSQVGCPIHALHVMDEWTGRWMGGPDAMRDNGLLWSIRWRQGNTISVNMACTHEHTHVQFSSAPAQRKSHKESDTRDGAAFRQCATHSALLLSSIYSSHKSVQMTDTTLLCAQGQPKKEMCAATQDNTRQHNTTQSHT